MLIGDAGSWTRTRLFGVATAVFLADQLTKRWALTALQSGDTFHALGGLVPLTLAFNTGIAFGIRIVSGPAVLLPLTLAVGFALVWLYRRARSGDPYRMAGIALVGGGAAGNLFDRVRWARGVVDFIGPIDFGVVLFPIFNLADVAITFGALLIAASIGWEERVTEEIEHVGAEVAGAAGAESTEHDSPPQAAQSDPESPPAPGVRPAPEAEPPPLTS